MTTLSDDVYKASAWEDIKECSAAFLEVVGLSMSCDERGVWVRNVGHPSLNWHPFNDLDNPVTQDPRQHPHLNFPFSARKLAAFMLDGVGYFVRDRFGDWADGPDDEALNSMPDEAVAAKDAITKAYQAYREALAAVGSLDPCLAERADELRLVSQAMLVDARARIGIDKARKELAGATDQHSIEFLEELWRRLDTWKESPAFQAAKADYAKAKQEADAGEQAWRKKMVKHLLGAGTSYATEKGQAVPQHEAWPLKDRVQRDDGLSTPVHEALKVARAAGKPRQNAREVLAYFDGPNRPKAILRVFADGCEYLDANGDAHTADLKKIAKRINEMTVRQRKKTAG